MGKLFSKLKSVGQSFYGFLQQCNSFLFVGFGIPVVAHWSFWLVALGLLLFNQPFAIAFALSMLSIIPHEFGHALMAKKFGIGCKKIVMLPIGGMAMLKEMPREPKKELLIAIAGPAVTAAIALLTFLPVWLLDLPLTSSITQLLVINLVLLVFNMLPCFPMDGGRVFRSVLSMFLAYLTATKIAVRTSQALCCGLMGLGVLAGSPSLVIISGLLILFAGAEYEMTQRMLEEEEQKKLEAEKKKKHDEDAKNC